MQVNGIHEASSWKAADRESWKTSENCFSEEKLEEGGYNKAQKMV